MLSRWLLLVFLAGPLPALASPDATGSVVAPAFGLEPEPAQVLARSCGGAGLGFAGIRLLADTDVSSGLQQIGRTPNVAMDNWWAQTGVALIDNNLLAQR